jgi:hypothetical protein
VTIGSVYIGGVFGGIPVPEQSCPQLFPAGSDGEKKKLLFLFRPKKGLGHFCWESRHQKFFPSREPRSGRWRNRGWALVGTDLGTGASAANYDSSSVTAMSEIGGGISFRSSIRLIF